MIYGRDTGGRIPYLACLRRIAITTRIAVAIIRDSALVITYHCIVLTDLLFSIGNPPYLLIKCASVPTANIINKVDIAEKHPDYTKGHIHNAALNRTATFLAKEIYKHNTKEVN